ncbi:MAG: transposase [Clostridiales bacterium]|nr:transposase [Clostridiales bacterium]
MRSCYRYPGETSPHKLVHLFVSNAKAMFQGTFHGLGAKRIQGYFSEFAYRFNRRDSKTSIVEHHLRSFVREGYTFVPELCI